MKKIVWLASYPKSGNTWFRVFLANLDADVGEPADINRLQGTGIASARLLFDLATGVAASDLTADEIERLRPRVYEAWAEAAPGVIFRKIHDAYTYTSAGEPMVSAAATQGAIYLVRNPLDVCASYAHHNHCDVETALQYMNNPAHGLCAHRGHITNQLRQHLSTWSNHVRSWLDAPDIPVHVVRYEDMKATPLETFTAAVRFAGLAPSDDEVRAALEQSAFERLQGQEQEHGFREKFWRAASFFRAGTVGGWRAALTPDQADRLVEAHAGIMRRLGYLSPDGQLLV